MLKHRKLVAIVLSLMMVLCLTPTIAFATDDGGTAADSAVELVGGGGTGGGNGGGNGGESSGGGSTNSDIITVKNGDVAGTEFSVEHEKTLELKAEVKNIEGPYHIHWKKVVK
ncbi:MAG: hypothetical protein ACI4KL_02245 [Lentihominibacter sp.]